MRDTCLTVGAMTGVSQPASRPEDMRAQLRAYVVALHSAYLGAARLLAEIEAASRNRPLLVGSA